MLKVYYSMVKKLGPNIKVRMKRLTIQLISKSTHIKNKYCQLSIYLAKISESSSTEKQFFCYSFLISFFLPFFRVFVKAEGNVLRSRYKVPSGNAIPPLPFPTQENSFLGEIR